MNRKFSIFAISSAFAKAPEEPVLVAPEELAFVAPEELAFVAPEGRHSVAGGEAQRNPRSADRGESQAPEGRHWLAGGGLIMTIIAIILSTATVLAQPAQPRAASNGRFTTVDVYIDSGDAALAAYQFELSATRGEFRIVGVEGGEHAAFAQPPYYDPAALNQDRVILAAFNTGRDLPTGKTRVARVHVQVLSDGAPEYSVELDVAADSQGQAIEAEASVN